MKTIAASSFLVLFALAIGVGSPAFADHSEVTIDSAQGSGVPGCEETTEGCYIPGTATVDVGGVVIMTNTDKVAHTYTSGDPAGGPDGAFDSSLVMIGSSFEWTPEEVGEYPYFCMVHPWMKGVIIVQEVGAVKDHHDDMMMMEDDMMMMEDDASGTGMLSDGTMVKVWTSTPTAGEALEVSIAFEGAEHVNHDIMVTQNGEEVLHDEGAHHHEGTGTHTTAPLGSADPVDITVTFQGYGIDQKTGPIGEEVAFTNVVPEFGTIAMMILVVAIISIVAVTAKSRVVPRF